LSTLLLRTVWCEQVERLVLVSGTAGIDDAAQPGERERRCAIDDERAAELLNDPKHFLATFWQLPLFADLQHHPEMPTWLAARQRRALAFTAMRSHWQRGLSVARMPSLWSRVTQLRNDIHVDVMVGALDAPYVAAGERLTSLLAGRVRLHRVEGVGHALPLLAPQTIVDVINSDQRVK
jgi:pimeloyl-ACP methyl ester carboxylesterase